MPTSDIGSIPAIINTICNLPERPKRILDLGIGFGKYGVLLREYLDINAGNIAPVDWKVWLEGFEGFIQYKNPIHEKIYDIVHYVDFSKYKEDLVGFDLVLVIDSLEHLERKVGEVLLTHLITNNRRVIVSCPDGDYPQGAVNGNEFECHRAVWLAEDFYQMGARLLHRGFCTVAMFSSQRAS